jgi:hypothetical protein
MKFRCALLLCTFLALGGCDSAPTRVPVTGSVSVNGKPAEGAILMFHPSDPKEATASAVAEADGSYKIVSGGESGLIQGKYQVTVIWPDPSKKPTQAQIMMGTAEPGPDLLKGKYSSKTTSPLSAEITSTSAKLPPFEL